MGKKTKKHKKSKADVAERPEGGPAKSKTQFQKGPPRRARQGGPAKPEDKIHAAEKEARIDSQET